MMFGYIPAKLLHFLAVVGSTVVVLKKVTMMLYWVISLSDLQES